MAKARMLRWLAIGLLMALPVFAQEPRPIHIGLAKTFLSEQPKGVADVASDDFKAVVKSTTGLDGEIGTKLTAGEIADKLDAKQLDFGIFHAHEFAWVQKKHPKLAPLLIATDKLHVERAYMIVHKNSPAKSIADLRGKKIDLPVGTKEHCRLYLEKACTDLKTKGPTEFFAAIEKSATKKDALDNVALGKADTAVIDRNGLDFYREIRGPVFEKNLRILTESGDFPPAVVVYKPGALDEKTVEQFRAGLLKAHTVPDGRDMMKSWNIQAFEPIPKDYAKSLDAILKAYPPASPK